MTTAASVLPDAPSVSEMGAPAAVLHEIDGLLRDRRAVVEAIRTERSIGGLCLRLGAATVALAAIYGLGVGLYRPVWQVLFVPVKVPILLLGPLAITLPALYVANALSGARLSLAQTAALGLVMTATSALMLAAATPIDALMVLTVRDPEWVRMGNLLLMAGAMLFGARVLRWFLRDLHMATAAAAAPPVRVEEVVEEDEADDVDDETPETIEEDEDDEAVEPVQAAPQAVPRVAAVHPAAPVPVGTGIWLVWLFLYAFVAVQLGWILRPFVATRFEEAPPFMRDISTHGSVFDWLGAFLQRIYGWGY